MPYRVLTLVGSPSPPPLFAIGYLQPRRAEHSREAEGRARLSCLSTHGHRGSGDLVAVAWQQRWCNGTATATRWYGSSDDSMAQQQQGP